MNGFPDGSVVNNLPSNAGDAGSMGLIPVWGRLPRVGNSILAPLVFLPGKSRGQRILVGHSPRGHKESNTT